jgi:hypothetical protein
MIFPDQSFGPPNRSAVKTAPSCNGRCVAAWRSSFSEAAYVCSTETCGAVEDGVEDGLQVVRRARNGAQLRKQQSNFADETLITPIKTHLTAELAANHFFQNARAKPAMRGWRGGRPA